MSDNSVTLQQVGVYINLDTTFDSNSTYYLTKYNGKVGLNYDHNSMSLGEMHRWIDIWPQITEKDSNVATAILLDQCCHKGDQISVASFCIKPDHYVWPPRCDLRLVYETDCIAYRVYNFDGFFVVNPIKV